MSRAENESGRFMLGFETQEWKEQWACARFYGYDWATEEAQIVFPGLAGEVFNLSDTTWARVILNRMAEDYCDEQYFDLDHPAIQFRPGVVAGSMDDNISFGREHNLFARSCVEGVHNGLYKYYEGNWLCEYDYILHGECPVMYPDYVYGRQLNEGQAQ